jgi:hypothetical protein
LALDGTITSSIDDIILSEAQARLEAAQA